jgi:hypothetical protein
MKRSVGNRIAISKNRRIFVEATRNDGVPFKRLQASPRRLIPGPPRPVGTANASWNDDGSLSQDTKTVPGTNMSYYGTVTV